MEKNTIVLDELGQKTGITYSKRASGLVKKGRAEYVNDHTIRMKTAHAPAILLDVINNMEEKTMSKVIDFNAREFRFDETCQGHNVGQRMFITDMFDKATEIFEIGDMGAWTQICADKVLEKDTDYVFRFGVLKGAGFGNTTSHFILVPDENWDDRFVFNLTNDEFKPTAIKKWNDNDFRIYEIPFNTGNVENFRFVIVQHAAKARIFPAREVSEYSFLENSTGESSRFGKPNFSFDFEKIKPNFDFDTESMKKDFTDFGKAAGETVKSAFTKISNVFTTSSDVSGAAGTTSSAAEAAAAAAEEWEANAQEVCAEAVKACEAAEEAAKEAACEAAEEAAEAVKENIE